MIASKRAVPNDRYFASGASDSGSNPDTPVIYKKNKIPCVDVRRRCKRDMNMNKKSITIIGKSVDFVYVIKDVNIDEVGLEKYAVKCSSGIESAWEGTPDNSDEQVLEVVLQEKISNVNLTARANVIEIASKNGGKIIKDYETDRAKKGKKVYMSELIFFKEAEQ